MHNSAKVFDLESNAQSLRLLVGHVKSACAKVKNGNSNYTGSKFRGSRFKVRLMKIERFEDIEAWQAVESLKVVRLARELTRKVYRLTKKPGLTYEELKATNREP